MPTPNFIFCFKGGLMWDGSYLIMGYFKLDYHFVLNHNMASNGEMHEWIYSRSSCTLFCIGNNSFCKSSVFILVFRL